MSNNRYYFDMMTEQQRLTDARQDEQKQSNDYSYAENGAIEHCGDCDSMINSRGHCPRCDY